ncbi:hypothetical protein FJZ36_03865 [Candidatus Poribacteria bacterium]|nr:hypothetical protein [Candidatus Poribacteria bacterium]
MWIEEGFRVLQSGQWNVERTRMTDPARIERLWMALSLATLWTLTLGDTTPVASRPELPNAPRLTQDGRRRMNRVRWGSVGVAPS